MPSKPLPGILALLELGAGATVPMIERGKEDAQKAINLGAGAMYDILHRWGGNEQTKKKFVHLMDYVDHVTSGEGNKE